MALPRSPRPRGRLRPRKQLTHARLQGFSANLYAFAANDPLNLADPLGLCANPYPYLTPPIFLLLIGGLAQAGAGGMVEYTKWIQGGFIELIYSSMAGSVLFDLALLHLNTPLSLINTAEPDHAIWDVMGLAVSGIQRYALTLGTSAESLHRWERPGNLFGNPTADCEALYEDWLIAYGRVFSPHRPTALDRPDWNPRSPREIQDIMLAANCMMAPKLPPIPLVQMLVHKPGTLENPGERIVPTATTSNIWAILPSIPLDTNGQPVATLAPTNQTTQIVFHRRGNLQTTFRLEVPDFVRIFRPDGSPYSTPESGAPTLSDPYTVLHFVSTPDSSSQPPTEPPALIAPATLRSRQAAPRQDAPLFDLPEPPDLGLEVHYSLCQGIEVGYEFNEAATKAEHKLVEAHLLPVDIEAMRRGEQQAPADGLLVKIGETLEFALAPQFFDAEDNFESLVTWQQRRLNGDGSYTQWNNISATAKGTTFEHTTGEAGIYQIKAIIDNRGEHLYVRDRNDPHGSNSRGELNPIYGTGQPDYIGVARDQKHIDIVLQARSGLGSKSWAVATSISISSGGATAGIGANKCNIFVYHKATAAGAAVPLDSGGWPPRAHEWYYDSFSITGWTWHPQSWVPEPGAVVSRYTLDWVPFVERIPRTSAHVGIVDYDGAWINAGSKSVNRYPHLTSGEYQPATFRTKN